MKKQILAFALIISLLSALLVGCSSDVESPEACAEQFVLAAIEANRTWPEYSIYNDDLLENYNMARAKYSYREKSNEISDDLFDTFFNKYNGMSNANCTIDSYSVYSSSDSKFKKALKYLDESYFPGLQEDVSSVACVEATFTCTLESSKTIENSAEILCVYIDDSWYVCNVEDALDDLF